jgi:hypothetical protein
LPPTRSGVRRSLRKGLSTALLAGLLVPWLTPTALAAGTICGTVRDALTSLPVARAGVFVRDTGGAYTGFYAATDDSGAFCIGGLAAGTYDLDIRVDDYRIGYVHDVEVTDGVTAVPPIDGEPAVRLAAPSPNPARASVLLGWSQAVSGPVSLRVFDPSGRLVQGWTTPVADAGDHRLAWNFESLDGRVVPAGFYFLVLDADGTRRVRTVVRLP